MRLFKQWRRSLQATALAVLTTTFLVQGWATSPAQAEVNRYCQLSTADAEAKATLLQAAQQGDAQAQQDYAAIVERHSAGLQSCRQSRWPRNQAVWLRLYPCDLQPGKLDALMDRIVNLGYNVVYIEAFYNGQVLLPANENRTAWPSVVQIEGYRDRDLLAEAIQKAHERDLKAYAWLFTLNFGYTYGQRADRQQVLARNGRGLSSADYAGNGFSSSTDEVFVDPYSTQAQEDYMRMLQAVLQRQPDGALFDYVRYPRGTGAGSVVSNVNDLWIYGSAAQQALLRRATNNKGRELIERFLRRGYVTEGDISQADQLYAGEREPLWQSRNPAQTTGPLPAASVRRPRLQDELWRLSVAHAIQGVVDFLQMGARAARQQNIPAGAVFFPEGNRAIGALGYDSRLQHWNRFPSWIERYPMSYATCGNTGCIVEQVQTVLQQTDRPQNVKPVLAGVWGRPVNNRPSLEDQMNVLERAVPEVDTVSHFAFSWVDPEFERTRQFCRF
ncbi:family 10 glycosylhydrolase [Romeria aff. gracilis LEGE 07310]|uniref:Family 10 glycosylhydrolase n=1 Tax=Vasconcelosia minhoensis LEGE 07310 TaxID=915328 RepID=A0A8J7DCA0_9CYAN|nr:family 10 glycosylhydrolase [Romeria gracilis]MBE9078682.1 family 10 glycosylhydrolase [Romeria aff. gracilis LEGE 07310]